MISGDIVPLDLQTSFKDSFNWINTIFLPWLNNQPAKYKIFIAGNHDFCFQDIDDLCTPKGIYYLRDESLELCGINFYGSPWTPWFWDWAFNFPRYDSDGAIAKDKWSKIPDNTNILITHGPPYNILDKNAGGQKCGCPYLRSRIEKLKNLKLHLWGHIHESFDNIFNNNVLCINASYGYKGQENYKVAPIFELDL